MDARSIILDKCAKFLETCPGLTYYSHKTLDTSNDMDESE